MVKMIYHVFRGSNSAIFIFASLLKYGSGDDLYKLSEDDLYMLKAFYKILYHKKYVYVYMYVVYDVSQ